MLGLATTMVVGGAGASVQDPPAGQVNAPVDTVSPSSVEAPDQPPAQRVAQPGLSSCGQGRTCIFRGPNYSIWKVNARPRHAGVWRWIRISDGVARRHYSAKNRFGGRRVLLRGTRANGTWRRYCLNPGASRPGPLNPGMLQVFVGRRGSRC
ncbi:MAG TPA: hypothetical protein VNO82_08615 [Solirubrobacteraceae bacterium]|nr:hypothetical protein [Solirubrobacteraceae bacterium]